ncbi:MULTISPECIES: hypothetical protein [Rhizobium]|uniref:hypothetical protein n=1 Tax=Rhizobium TaxID=379 RepID=UPI0011328B50|nr:MULTISPECIES: hypothetical protein [Rhizobium]
MKIFIFPRPPVALTPASVFFRHYHRTLFLNPVGFDAVGLCCHTAFAENQHPAAARRSNMHPLTGFASGKYDILRTPLNPDNDMHISLLKRRVEWNAFNSGRICNISLPIRQFIRRIRDPLPK